MVSQMPKRKNVKGVDKAECFMGVGEAQVLVLVRW
jgi:hypothetical protein